jgi:hypothetical protein
MKYVMEEKVRVVGEKSQHLLNVKMFQSLK